VASPQSYSANLGLHLGQEPLLMQLLDRDGQTRSELLYSVGLDHATVSKSVLRIKQAGLLKRIASVSHP
jgi:DNA-binding MarR family transcriptional regulator